MTGILTDTDLIYAKAREEWDRARRGDSPPGIGPMERVRTRNFKPVHHDPWNDPEVHDPYSAKCEADQGI